jgi:hypothetical protein
MNLFDLYGSPRQSTDDNTVAWWTHKATDAHSECHTYCFSTSAVIATMCLSVVLYAHCLSCFPFLQTDDFAHMYWADSIALMVRFTGHSRIVGAEACFISRFWHLEFEGGFQMYGKFVGPCVMLSCRENLVFVERTLSSPIAIICSSHPEQLSMLHHVSYLITLLSLSYFVLYLFQVWILRKDKPRVIPTSIRANTCGLHIACGVST